MRPPGPGEGYAYTKLNPRDVETDGDAPQRAARLSARRDPNRMPTKLQEFLRWQEWYVQYCRLRKIN